MRSTDPHTLVALLKACTKQKDLQTGIRIHADIIASGRLEKNVYLGSSIVNLYAKCGSLAKAQEAFDALSDRDVVTWSVLIAGYVQQGRGEHALKCFQQMLLEGLAADAITYVCILKACGSAGDVEKGKELHAKVASVGLVDTDVVVGNALVDMYAKCGMLERAQEVFDNLPVQDVVSWNALMTGYAQHGHGEQVVTCFEQMQLKGFSPDAVTYVCVLKACGIMGGADKGKEVHMEIIRQGLFTKDTVLGNALVDMYAKCGLLAKAQEVFDQLPVQNVVSWSTLMAGYAKHGFGEQAIKCYDQMEREGVSADAVTYICTLKACGTIGAADKGKEIHAQITRKGLLKRDKALGNALVDMYVKCGLLSKAQEVFDTLQVRDVVSWSALMAGYALFGNAEHVFYLFDKMVEEGVKPNPITFTVALNACSHSGLLEKSQMFFETMATSYELDPTLEHHTCMVDIFARAGHLGKAVTMIKMMPFSADHTVWLTLLGACQKLGNMKLGRVAFQHAVHLDEKKAAAYIWMSNICSAGGTQEDVAKFEAMGVENQALTLLIDCC